MKLKMPQRIRFGVYLGGLGEELLHSGLLKDDLGQVVVLLGKLDDAIRHWLGAEYLEVVLADC